MPTRNTSERTTTLAAQTSPCLDTLSHVFHLDRTRALLGLRAREIHVCGGLEAEKIVRSLAESAGDEFTLQRYERLSTLK
jgi:ATP-dependent RNA helicase SUPV3L1/SUV3